MPVLFSRACEYALRGLVEMASHPEQEFWTVQELAEQTNTPAPFLAKTFQTLVKSGVLNSTKGRHGGFSFAMPVKKISLMDIVNIIDGPTLAKDCALGFPECGGEETCPFHIQWSVIRETIIDALSKQSLEKFAAG
ncbi:MAG: RrF2 family transcriptional regulator [bacterium]